ncbi:MAG TPA: SAV_915 family protein [Thermomonospora sp.]|nr:SAV_915 family protein [Thermomonospora sp.]
MTLRTGRLPEGERVGLAFSTHADLVRVFGPEQEWVRLSPPALRALLGPLGVTRIHVDVRGALDPVVLSLTPARPPAPAPS